MDNISRLLQVWGNSRCDNISVGGLISRNRTAHKWKAPYRSFVLRECVFWRFHDLLSQAHVLFNADHVLGSRILTRSAMETLAILIYLNQVTESVLLGKLNFHEFSDKTTRLLMGSRDGTTGETAINILSVLGHCEKRYNGILDVYAALSESAHPNWEGMCFGYSRVDHDEYESNFSNNWVEMWASKHEPLVLMLAEIFESEYNDIWHDQMLRLEKWIEENDAMLEATKISS